MYWTTPWAYTKSKVLSGNGRLLAVGDLEGAGQALLLEVGAGEVDGRRGEIDAGDRGAALRETGQVDAGAAADFENRSPAVAVKGHEPQQMVELFEMVLVEVVEKAPGTDRMARDLEIVDMVVPVGAHIVGRSHAGTIPAAVSGTMPVMARDLDRLTDRTFDILVVGGGIYGLTIAYDAAQRGLSVALIERDDFGSGSSFNHLRTIHGGLRYLQSLDLARARESIHERRAVARIAPQAVRPLPFAVPLYRSLLRGKLAMRAGFALDRIVAAGRNRGVPPSHRLPGGRVFSRSRAAQTLSRPAASGPDRRGGILRLRHD